MAYRDTPFNDDIPLFPRAHHVEDYLRMYADVHHLLPYIRFETSVTRVYKRTEGKRSRWIVESRRKGAAENVEEEFDFVSVTNGHYEKASTPEIPGLRCAIPLLPLSGDLPTDPSFVSDFSGQIMHSRWYRRPEDFMGKVSESPHVPLAKIRQPTNPTSGRTSLLSAPLRPAQISQEN